MDEKNVLLLSMSTLPPGITDNYYFINNYDKGIRTYICRSQLEPGTKAVLDMLADNNEKLDKVFIIATDKTRTYKRPDAGNETAVGYYRKRITDFILGQEKNDKAGSALIDEKDLSDLIDKQEITVFSPEKLNIYLKKIKTEYMQVFASGHEELNIDDDTEKNLVKSLQDEDKETDIDKYEEFCNKYKIDLKNYTHSNVRLRLNALKVIKAMYARLRRNYEIKREQVYDLLDIIKKLNEKINRLNEEIERCTHATENAVKQFVKKYLYEKYKNACKVQSPDNNRFKALYGNISDAGTQSDLFDVIPLDDGKEYDAIPEIAGKFSQLGSNVNLYIDMQGGRRNETFIINAVINMLKVRNINVVKSFATDYDNENVINEIKDITLTNNIYDMVSGMDAFLRYGRGDNFKEYYAKYRVLKNIGEDTELPEDCIVNDIEQISEAISMCDVETLPEKIRTIYNHITNYKEAQGKDPLFATLVEDIYNEYTKLRLAWGAIPDNILAIIRWCVEKGLIQQALTLCEAKIPDIFVKKGIIYYAQESDSNTEKNARRAFTELKNDKKFAEWQCRNTNYFFVKYYLERKKIIDDNGELTADGNESKLKVFSNLSSDNIIDKATCLNTTLDNYRKICRYRNGINHAKRVNGRSVAYNEIVDEIGQLCEKLQYLIGRSNDIHVHEFSLHEVSSEVRELTENIFNEQGRDEKDNNIEGIKLFMVVLENAGQLQQFREAWESVRGDEKESDKDYEKKYPVFVWLLRKWKPKTVFSNEKIRKELASSDNRKKFINRCSKLGTNKEFKQFLSSVNTSRDVQEER